MCYKTKYNDALARAKKLKETCDNLAVIGWCEYIFPDLKESEDEKIRKMLLKHIISTQYFPMHGFSKEQILKWFEKQKKNDNDTHNTNIKRKFNPGDWIIDKRCGKIKQVTSVVDNGYYCDNGDYMCFECSDKYFRHWTINDAKKYDVLAYIHNNVQLWVMIYESISGPFGNVYCHAILKGDTFVGPGGYAMERERLHPATKEQRDLLFSKMKECGYEWNSEKNILIKIKEK